MEDNYAESFVDTNIVVRSVTGDPPDQAAEAIRILHEGRNIQIPVVVFTEVAYVLASQYRISQRGYN